MEGQAHRPALQLAQPGLILPPDRVPHRVSLQRLAVRLAKPRQRMSLLTQDRDAQAAPDRGVDLQSLS